ncbi:MAG: M67 family metallopeptidase [Sedimentisphaerales bacterium]|nr:M67 family metallopeptidase [Sedimentisphaerales bacterium]
MIRIPRPLLNEIISQAKESAPLEACGLIAGTTGLAKMVIPMSNLDQSPQHFMMDPKEQFAAAKTIRKNGYQLLAIYHSHPSSPARPSAEDVRLALTPDVAHVIISLVQPSTPEVRAFKIEDGVIEEEELEIVDEQ